MNIWDCTRVANKRKAPTTVLIYFFESFRGGNYNAAWPRNSNVPKVLRYSWLHHNNPRYKEQFARLPAGASIKNKKNASCLPVLVLFATHMFHENESEWGKGYIFVSMAMKLLSHGWYPGHILKNILPWRLCMCLLAPGVSMPLIDCNLSRELYFLLFVCFTTFSAVLSRIKIFFYFTLQK